MKTEIGFGNKQEVAASLVEESKAMVVTNPQEHAAAGAIVESIRVLEKELASEYAAHPTVVEAKKLQKIKGDLAEILETARKETKGKQMAWEDKQEKLRVAEENRLAAIAKKEADDAALAEAQALQVAGEKDAAIAVLEEAVMAPTPVVILPREAPKTANRRTIWRFRITNQNLIPKAYLIADEKKIGGVVRSLGADANIPGIEVFPESV